MLQECVTWVSRSLTARTLLGIGAVQIMGFGQIFYCIVTLARLWMNQGLPQTAGKRKVGVDLVFLLFVLSLPLPAALLAQHRAEAKAQERVAVICRDLPCGPGADPALVPAPLLALAQHPACSAKQEGSLHSVFSCCCSCGGWQ